MLEDLPRTASARAKTDVELVRINGATFDAMLKSNTRSRSGCAKALAQGREVTDMLRRQSGHRPDVGPGGRNSVSTDRSRRRADSLVGAGGATAFFLHRRGTPGSGAATGHRNQSDVDLAALDPQRSTSRRHRQDLSMAGKALPDGGDRRDERDTS